MALSTKASDKPAAKTAANPESIEAPKPAKKSAAVEVGGFSVNFETRADNPWSAGKVRAGIEGERACGYGDTEDEALAALKTSKNL
tara:strand:+ start:3597 stop:3854 length:258 start_codon:yes stop_codon:yes gene_type:complete